MTDTRLNLTGRITLGKMTGEFERIPGATPARARGFYAPIEAPFPETRLLRWAPEGGDSSFHPAHDVALVVTQEVFTRINRHLASSLDRELGGFLLGNRYRCPNSGREYVVVDQCTKARMTESNEIHLAFTLDTWAYLADELSGKFYGKLVVGWYHSHPRMDVFLSSYDVTLHEERFAAPWMTALVVEPERNRGGFFRWQGGRLNPRTPSEFYELVARGADGTVVDWTNHVSAGGLRPEPSSSMRVPRATTAVEAAPEAPARESARGEVRRPALASLAYGAAGAVLGAVLGAAGIAGAGIHRGDRDARTPPVVATEAVPPERGGLAPLEVETVSSEAVPEEPAPAIATERREKPAPRSRAKRSKPSQADPMRREPAEVSKESATSPSTKSESKPAPKPATEPASVPVVKPAPKPATEPPPARPEASTPAPAVAGEGAAS
jgi:proteasome lid subunit RPN8/RPN11